MMFRNENANTDLIVGVCSFVCTTIGYNHGEYLIALCGVGCLGVVIYRGVCRMLGKKVVEAPPAVSPARQRHIAAAKRKPKNTQEFVDLMISQGRYALLLRPEVAKKLTPEQLAQAAQLVRDEMASVEGGTVRLKSAKDAAVAEADQESANGVSEEVPSLFVDRYAVTNAEYQLFIDAGGYDKDELWDEAAADFRNQFVGANNCPGPRYFENGTFADGTENHPVVGICWYEAAAYARWAGKRLPTDPEWTKAASCPQSKSMSYATQPQYPWGNSLDEARANLWWSGVRSTVEVTSHPEGDTLTGARQMIGNVWEWTDEEFGRWSGREGWLETAHLKSLRGGAFDTYVESEAACTTGSADDAAARKHNIGFRCVLEAAYLDNISTADQSLTA